MTKKEKLKSLNFIIRKLKNANKMLFICLLFEESLGIEGDFQEEQTMKEKFPELHRLIVKVATDYNSEWTWGSAWGIDTPITNERLQFKIDKINELKTKL